MLKTLLVVAPIGRVNFVFGLCFLICFLISNRHDKEESWLLHFNHLVDISVICPFLKDQ